MFFMDRSQPMTLTEYFSKPESPAQASPVAVLMVGIFAKDPSVGYDEARSPMQCLLQKAAGKNIYCVPRMLGPDERTRLKARVAARPKSEHAESFRPFLAFSGTHSAAI